MIVLLQLRRNRLRILLGDTDKLYRPLGRDMLFSKWLTWLNLHIAKGTVTYFLVKQDYNRISILSSRSALRFGGGFRPLGRSSAAKPLHSPISIKTRPTAAQSVSCVLNDFRGLAEDVGWTTNRGRKSRGTLDGLLLMVRWGRLGAADDRLRRSQKRGSSGRGSWRTTRIFRSFNRSLGNCGKFRGLN